MPARKPSKSRKIAIRCTGLLGELETALHLAIDSERSLRENRLLHTDNNIRALIAQLRKMMDSERRHSSNDQALPPAAITKD